MGVECALWEVTTEQLEVLLDSPEAVDALICGEPGRIKAAKCLDLGKAWGVLHFLLTGEAYGESFPLGYAILVGYKVTDDIHGATYLPAEDVKEVARALARISEDEFRERFDPAALRAAEVYRGALEEDDLDWLLPMFRDLKRFYRLAARKGRAILRHID